MGNVKENMERSNNYFNNKTKYYKKHNFLSLALTSETSTVM